MKKIQDVLHKALPKIIWLTLYGLIIGAYVWPLLSLADTPPQSRVVWDKRPIPITLTVGQERLVHFPSDVRYWMPESIRDRVSMLSANGVVYITAHMPLETTRIRVQSLVTHTMYLLDLNTSDIEQHRSDIVVTDQDFVENVAKQASSNDTASSGDWFVRLTRYAAQTLYAPERLHPSDRDITSIRLAHLHSLPLIRGGFIKAIPLRSWRGGGYTVTAVQLRNLTSEHIDIVHEATRAERAMHRLLVLDEDIRGDWLALTTQHRALAPRESGGEWTTLYVISQRSFDESMERF